MDDRKEYTVHINGIPHTMLLSKEDARRRGLIKAAPKGEAVDVEAEVAKQVEERVSALEAEFEARVEAEVARRVEERVAEAAKTAEASKAPAAKVAEQKNK